MSLKPAFLARAAATAVLVVIATLFSAAPAQATDPDTLDWKPAVIQQSEIDIYQGDIPHYALYFNVNMAFNYYIEYFKQYYADHPEEVEGMEDWEIEEQATSDAWYKLENIRHSLEEDVWAEYFMCVDTPDQDYKVKKVTHSPEGETVQYFPRDAEGGAGSIDDESQFVMEAHDFYRCEWHWTDEDHVQAEFFCMLGQDNFDGTNDTIFLDAQIKSKVITREPTELTDGEMEVTASIWFPDDYTYLDVEFTNTKKFTIPATGNPERAHVTVQPQDVTINYPDGATFHVEVDRPDLIVSYQWVQVDPEGRTYRPEGSTATTDTLVIPSTERYMELLYYHCEMTDINGNKVISEPAALYIPNFSEDKNVLHVGDLALNPGETLDLSTTHLGTGIVKFSEDGLHATFENVNLTTENYLFDFMRADSSGVYLRGNNQSHEEPYVMEFIGDCVFNNPIYDEETQSGGVIVNSHVNGSSVEEPNMVVLTGSGTLTTIGGNNGIFADSDIEIDLDVTTIPYKNFQNTGIATEASLHLCPGATINITCADNGIIASGNVFVDNDVDLTIYDTAYRPNVGFPEQQGIIAGGNVVCYDATIKITMDADPEVLVPYGRRVGEMIGIASNAAVVFYGTDVTIEMTAQPCDEPYAGGYTGISGEYFTGLYLEDGAKCKIKINCEDVNTSYGVSSGLRSSSRIEIENGSVLDIELANQMSAIGIDIDEPLLVRNASLIVNTACLDDPDSSYGVMVPEATFDLAGSGVVDITTTGDIAYYAFDYYAEYIDDPTYDPDYVPVLTDIVDGTFIFEPEGGIISTYQYGLDGAPISGETVYDPASPDAPAKHVYLSANPPVEISYYVADGDGSTWTKGTETTLPITFKRSVDDETTFDHFDSIEIDGAEVDMTHYLAYSGSVVITLKADYLETLEVGSHELKAVFDDGEATATFTITVPENEGDDSKDSTDDQTDEGTDNNGQSDNASDNAGGSTPTQNSSDTITSTGDSLPVMLLVMIAAAAAVCAGVAATRRAHIR